MDQDNRISRVDQISVASADEEAELVGFLVNFSASGGFYGADLGDLFGVE
jgi:hypothetical protein